MNAAEKARAREDYWTQQVIGLAIGLGLLAYWHPDSRRAVGSSGYPDVTAAGPRGVLFAELKMPGADTSAGQDLWGWTLNEAGSHCSCECEGAGILWFIWTVPGDFESGRIQRDLERLL